MVPTEREGDEGASLFALSFSFFIHPAAFSVFARAPTFKAISRFMIIKARAPANVIWPKLKWLGTCVAILICKCSFLKRRRVDAALACLSLHGQFIIISAHHSARANIHLPTCDVPSYLIHLPSA